MSVYRWLAYDLRTNTAIEELPLAVRQFSGVLNAPGTFTAEMPVDDTNASRLMTATIPERTVVYVERDGVLLDGYIIWQRRRAPDQPVGLQGASLSSYLKRNRIVANWTYTATDQFTIARGIVDHMQAQTGANIGISTGSGTCGVTRDRTYYAYERGNIYEMLDNLASVDNGFDWAIDVAWSAGAPAKSLTLSYPRRGRIAGSTGVVFESGKNVLGYEFLEDGTRSARSVDAIGAGDGVDMLISTSTDTSLIDAGYPLTADKVSHKDVTIQATLDAHAIAARKARATTPTFLTLTVAPDDVDAGLGTWIVGDDVLVRLTDSNFPVQSDGRPGHLAYYRILAYDVDVPDVGPETVNVTLGSIL